MRLQIMMHNIEEQTKQKRASAVPDEIFGFTDINGAKRITGLSISAIYKMTARNELPFYKPSGKLLFKISELIEWIERSRN